MAINFPSSPTTGQVYEYQSIRWRWNGSAWDKYEVFTFNGLTANVEGVSRFNGLTGSVGITAGQLIDITLTGNTFTISSPDILYGISGSIYASSLATGLLYGGILSINGGNTAQFDITAGKGQIHASGSTFTSDPLPTFNYVTWPAQTGIPLTYLSTNDTTWIYIDGSGVLHQRTEYYTDEQLEENIIIGQLIHPSRSYISLARTNPNVAYATDKQYEQFIRSFGPIKISGHTISPNGANLKLNRTSGKAFSLGRNWINDTDNPSVVSDPAQTDCIFYRYYTGITAGTFITVPNQTVIDPANYDDGSGVLQAAPSGKYTIQRLFYYPNTPTLLGVYYGRSLYNSLADAAANINLENFTEIENTRTNAIFAGYLIVKAGATNLSNTSDALILQAGSFRSTTSGGGSVSLTLDDLTDVIITAPQDFQVLTYVDGVTGWENKSVSTLPLVYSFNGATGAVSGVNSVNGLTGILTVSGGTGMSVLSGDKGITVSNTGVLSFNGLTGAVTGVTTSVANTFTALQTFNVGITAAGATLANIRNVNNLSGRAGITFASNSTSITNSILLKDGANDIDINSGSGTVSIGLGGLGALGTSSKIKLQTTDGDVTTTYGTIDSGTLTSNRTYTLPDATGTFVLDTNISSSAVTSYNGRVGAVQGVSAAVAGIGISVSGATGSVTITNTGVQSFNGLTGAVSGVTTSVANTFTALQTFNAGITTSGITLNGRITASGLGTFNSGITTSGITLNGNLVASGSGKFNSGVLTDFVAPTTGLGVGGVLYLNADGIGAGGGGAVTYIGDVVGDTNNTYIAVDDSNVEINLYAANGQINSFGPIYLNNHCTFFTAQVTSDTNTANQTIFSYDGSSWCGAEFIITAQQGALSVVSMKTCKILVANTSSTVNHTEYGEVVVGTDFVTFDVSISGGSVSLTMTPSGNSLVVSTVVGVKATLFPVSVGI
jgi:hypothetical protein